MSRENAVSHHFPWLFSLSLSDSKCSSLILFLSIMSNWAFTKCYEWAGSDGTGRRRIQPYSTAFEMRETGSREVMHREIRHPSDSLHIWGHVEVNRGRSRLQWQQQSNGCCAMTLNSRARNRASHPQPTQRPCVALVGGAQFLTNIRANFLKASFRLPLWSQINVKGILNILA